MVNLLTIIISINYVAFVLHTNKYYFKNYNKYYGKLIAYSPHSNTSSRSIANLIMNSWLSHHSQILLQEVRQTLSLAYINKICFKKFDL